jgi:hypothetical protein
MIRFLKNVVAVLKKSSKSEPAGRPERPSPMPLLAVHSQVKAGSYDLATHQKG